MLIGVSWFYLAICGVDLLTALALLTMLGWSLWSYSWVVPLWIRSLLMLWCNVVSAPRMEFFSLLNWSVARLRFGLSLAFLLVVPLYVVMLRERVRVGMLRCSWSLYEWFDSGTIIGQLWCTMHYGPLNDSLKEYPLLKLHVFLVMLSLRRGRV